MMALPLILVTGSNGQLGSELKELASASASFAFRFFSREELSITHQEEIERAFALLRPSVVVNCAAYTAVDKAETEKEQALAVNATGPGLLAAASKKYGAKFIHISTDYVFDGNTKEPLKEESPVAPVNFYGESKLQGEQKALQAHPESIIIRTSWVYSSYGKNFVKTMLRLMAEKESINVVADQYGSPTYAADLARAIMQIVESRYWQPGIFHFSNEGFISWAQFAEEIAKQTNSSCKVNFISTDQYPTPASRPLYSVMCKEKIKHMYSISIQPWKKSLQACLLKLKEAGNFH